MKQVPVTSASGMFTRFNITRVLKVSECNSDQLLRAFDTLRVDEVHHEESLVVVHPVLQKNSGRLRQYNILKGVLVSEEYYEAQKLANPAVLPFIQETLVADDFLLPQDRFSRLMERTAPTQNRRSSVHVIPGGGVVDVGVAFVDATLEIEPVLVPVLVSGATGEVTFALIDVGTEVTLTYVTQAIHPTFKIRRQNENPAISELRIENETHAVLMNSTLAGLLGIALPAY